MTSNQYYFRVKYKNLTTDIKLSNSLRCDIKFKQDLSNKFVFSLHPTFETLSEESIVGDDWEALDSGTALISKPIFSDNNNYYNLIRQRVFVGAIAFFASADSKIAEIEVIEILNEI